MSEVLQKFKLLFVSPKNSSHIFEIVLKKVMGRHEGASGSVIKQNIETYQKHLFELQQYIFANIFPQILQQQTGDGTFSIEDALISLNQLTMRQLEYLIEEDLRKHTPESPPPQAYVRTPAIVEDTSLVHTNAQPEKAPDQLSIQYHHLFSYDATQNAGQYAFEMQPVVRYVTSLHLSSFKMQCQLYNIHELNNEFQLHEDTHKTIVAIPIGYYTTQELMDKLADVMTAASVNKYVYSVKIHPTKRKVYLSATRPESSLRATFGIMFLDKRTASSGISMREMLGFSHHEYLNNDLYVSESFPSTDVYDTLYLKLFLNGKEVVKYLTSTANFGYFQCFDLSYEGSRGKPFVWNAPSLDFFDIQEDINVKDISFQFYTSPHHRLSRIVDFETVLAVEHEVR